MSNPILGKWQEVSQEGIEEFYQAIGLPDPAPESTGSFEFSVDEDGKYTEVFDNGSSQSPRTFISGEESNGITTIVEGNVITETDKLDNGNVMNVKRVFEGSQMVTTLTSPNVEGLGVTMIFKKL